MSIKTDVVIVGAGVSGLFCALHLPEYLNVLLLCKEGLEDSNSFLAQGGICVLHDPDDYNAFYQDTMAAGHYENDPAAVETMIRTSPEIIAELLALGVPFAEENGRLLYTKESGHSRPRIAFHKDITGRAITSALLAAVKQKNNVAILDHFTVCDMIEKNNCCYGVVGEDRDHSLRTISANYTVLAAGGIGGLYQHSTNCRHLTGDAVAMALRRGVAVQNLHYVQIHPTTLYSREPGRRFLISESVRGEGAVLLDKNQYRFVNELLPRDRLTEAIHRQMEKDGTDHVWLSMVPLGKETILSHFPNIYQKCLDAGYDAAVEPIPVVPAQHYFMGGIAVDLQGRTSMEQLYAVGETACSGVHGANRLASNSLLESLVFAKRAAETIAAEFVHSKRNDPLCEQTPRSRCCSRSELEAKNRELILAEMKKEKIS